MTSNEMRLADDIDTGDDSKKEEVFHTKVYWYAVVCGYAFLTPWNAVLTCMFFFQELYEGTSFEPQFTLPMIMFLPLTGFQIVIIAWGKLFPMKAKIVTCFALLSLFFYIFLFVTYLISNKTASFAVAVIVTLIMGAFNAITQGTTLGLFGAMGCQGKYMNGAMIGNGISGILCNVIQFLCLAVVPEHETVKGMFHVTCLYFIIIGITMVASTYISYLLMEHSFTKEVLHNLPAEQSIGIIFSQAWPVFKSMGKNVFLVFVFTFIVFPGVIITEPMKCFSKAWSIPMMIFIFNILDTVGRTLPSYWLFIKKNQVILYVMLRGIFILTFSLTAFRVADGFFVNDLWIVINLILFAFTNGYCSTVSMMYGPEDFEDSKKEVAGKMMAFYLTFGIFFGSVLGEFVMAKLLDHFRKKSTSF